MGRLRETSSVPKDSVEPANPIDICRHEERELAKVKVLLVLPVGAKFRYRIPERDADNAEDHNEDAEE